MRILLRILIFGQNVLIMMKITGKIVEENTDLYRFPLPSVMNIIQIFVILTFIVAIGCAMHKQTADRKPNTYDVAVFGGDPFLCKVVLLAFGYCDKSI